MPVFPEELYSSAASFAVAISSLPTGKNGTHSVITGHSGLTMSKMFSDLPELTTEDCFYIYFLDEKIKYQIYSIETVKPSEVTNHLGYNRSEGYCTLMTCTPIGVNTHRLLVHGKRVEVVFVDGLLLCDEKIFADWVVYDLCDRHNNENNTALLQKVTKIAVISPRLACMAFLTLRI